MLKTLLSAKIHRATCTHAELHYEGSCAIDQNLLDAAGIVPFEQLHIYNINNGQRFTTYAICAEAGSGIISLNGAAARLAQIGDLLIIATYQQVACDQLKDFAPKLVYVDENNRISHTGDAIAMKK